MSAEWRAAMQERTAGVALVLSRLPRLLLIVIFGAVVLLGLAGPGLVGAIPLLLIAAFLGWLLLLGWEQRAPVERVIRVAVLLVILAYAVYKLS